MKTAPNNLLIGLAVVVLAGAGGLGYMISKSAGEYSEARTKYEQNSNEYNRLRRLPLYPDSANLKKLEEQAEVAMQASETLRKKLEPMSIPLEAISPEQFQDRLRATVSSVSQRAAAAKLKLPDKFYLGFDEYRSQPPKADAAAPLLRQLKALELVMTTLIDAKVDSLNVIQRSPLPEESGRVAGEQPLVFAAPFEIQFTSDQLNFRTVLNNIVGSTKQFFITRSLAIKNGHEKPTPKGGALEGTSGEGELAGGGKKDSALQYIVGTEKINVTLHLEMVVFANKFSK